jgi:hypothetical protein
LRYPRPSALGISPAAAGARPPPPAYSAGAGVHTSHGHSALGQRCFQLLAAVPAPSDRPASVRRGTGYVTTPPATVGAWRGSLPGRTAHGKKTARPPVTAPAHGCRHLVAGSRRRQAHAGAGAAVRWHQFPSPLDQVHLQCTAKANREHYTVRRLVVGSKIEPNSIVEPCRGCPTKKSLYRTDH